MNSDSIDWYIQQIKSEHYNQFIDDHTSLKMSRKKFKNAFINLINDYRRDIPFVRDIRLIVKDKRSDIMYGSVIVMCGCDDGIYELAYWLDEGHTGKGIAFEALTNVINQLYKIDMKHLKLTIQSRNSKSIALATRCGFKLRHTDGDNVIYCK